jgi:hypothetical protein
MYSRDKFVLVKEESILTESVVRFDFLQSEVTLLLFREGDAVSWFAIYGNCL